MRESAQREGGQFEAYSHFNRKMTDDQCDQMDRLFFNFWTIKSTQSRPKAYKIC